MKFFSLLFTLLLLLQPISASAKRKQATPLRVACIGNSITYGTGVEDRERNAYPVQLQQLLGARYVVGNFGRPGATLLRKGHRPYMQQPEFRAALDFRPDIALIHLGINDTDPRNWPHYRDEFVGDYLALIDSLRAVNPRVRLLVAQMTPIAHTHPRFRSGTKEWHGQIQHAIQLVAQAANAQLIDFYTPFHNHLHLMPDGIHPNAEGATLLATTVAAALTGDYGGLQLSPLYGDGMVLQRGRPIRLRGLANANTKVKVELGDKTATTRAGLDGRWEVVLPEQPVGDSYRLRIENEKQVREFRDVAVGEVWLCSGQSNMQFELKHSLRAKQVLPTANDPQLRLMHWRGRWDTSAQAWPTTANDSMQQLLYYQRGQWTKTTPQTAADFSAVAYHFGRQLRDSLGVPVGLILNAVGGSTTESWVSRELLETDFPDILTNWLENDFVDPWVRGRAAQNISKGLSNGQKATHHPYAPAYLYESGIAPMAGYDLRGVIWYQGESNAHNITTNERLFRLLVRSWREQWGEKLPFYFVQLSSLSRPSWSWMRDSQYRLVDVIPHTAMAVSHDVGDSLDVHPRAKQEVGQRLARLALAHTYAHQLEAQGPTPLGAYGQQEVVVTFSNAEGLTTTDGRAPATFELAGSDERFYPAEAVIEGNGVRLRSTAVAAPRWVRYAWAPFTRANLVNAAQLPTTTFRLPVYSHP